MCALGHLDTTLAAQLVMAQRAAVADDDRAPLLEVAGRALDRAGGCLLEGYRDDGEDPATDAEVPPR